MLSFADEACSCSLLRMEATRTERNTGSWKQFPFCNTDLSYSIHNRGRPDQGHLKTKFTYLTSPQLNVYKNLHYRQQHLYQMTESDSTTYHYISCFYFPSTANVAPSRHQHQVCSAGHRAQVCVQQELPNCTQEGQNPCAAGHSSIWTWLRAEG